MPNTPKRRRRARGQATQHRTTDGQEQIAAPGGGMPSPLVDLPWHLYGTMTAIEERYVSGICANETAYYAHLLDLQSRKRPWWNAFHRTAADQQATGGQQGATQQAATTGTGTGASMGEVTGGAASQTGPTPQQLASLNPPLTFQQFAEMSPQRRGQITRKLKQLGSTEGTTQAFPATGQHAGSIELQATGT
jgi:hypothetical protein